MGKYEIILGWFFIFYNNIDTTIREIIIVIKSVNNPTIRAYLVFFIPIVAKYRLIIYIVVSVLPCNTDATLPTKLSGPYVERMLSNKIKDELPDIGRITAIGNNSLGKFKISSNGSR